MALSKQHQINWCENTRKQLKEAADCGDWFKVWTAIKMLEKLEKEMKESQGHD
jgi:hypothetical protein